MGTRQNGLGNRFLSSIFAFMRVKKWMCWTLMCIAAWGCSNHAPEQEENNGKSPHTGEGHPEAGQNPSLPAPEKYLMTSAELDSLLQTDPHAVSVIDVRPVEEYLAGHIPGSLNVWRPAFSDASLPFSSITAPRAQLQALFGGLGIERSKRTVVYDGKMGADAANFCWIMGLCAYDDTRLLDGGLPAWQKAGLPLDRNPARPGKHNSASSNPGRNTTPPPTSQTLDSSRYASAADVLEAMHDPQTVILDTRTWDEYTGAVVKDGALKGGHIPGSVWMDFSEALEQKDGCFLFKPADQLSAIFASKGITPDKQVISYCHSGARSAHTTFVLSRMLGYPSVRNFDGSWEEWTQDAHRPIETGDPTKEKLN
jgi:thiosulfate/3-mercaptopyruvate sulfurtransferase